MGFGGAGQRPTSPTGLGYFALGGFEAVEGSDGVSAVRINTYARQNTASRPYGVVNDYIASRLGTFIGLPVPPGLLVKLSGDIYGYLSMAFGIKGDRLPPVIFDQFAIERPWDAWGIIAFDQWVANWDRHDENLAYAPSVGVAVFDHDMALLARTPGSESQACSTLRQGRDLEVKAHSLAPHMLTSQYLDSWCERISTVRTTEVSRLVNDCVNSKLISHETAVEIQTFVEHRKTRVRNYIERTMGEYDNITEWPFDSPGGAK